MNHDFASELSETARRVPFPPAQRRVVLALFAPFTETPMKPAWLRWAGESDFGVFREDYGVCILEKGLSMPALWVELVHKVFERGGDVFEFCPVRENFTRIDETTFRLFYC